jgi:ABC-type glutathione transport system ATPase component
MGNSGVGKTSMHSIIFSNLSPYETDKIGYTVGKS